MNCNSFKHLKKLALALAVLLVLPVCSPQPYLAVRNLSADEAGIDITETAYGPDPRQTSTRYTPKGTNPDPARAVVFIHGGGWQGGDKASWHKHCLDLVRSFPCTIYNINYRLGSVKNAVTDCETFICKLKKRHQKIVLIGFSAGGHISLCLAEKDLVDGVVSYAGPTDLTGKNSTPLFDYYLRKGQLAEQDVKKYSPIYLCENSGSKVPIYLVHSTGDSIVSIAQAQDYYRRKQPTTDITLRTAKGEHGFQFLMSSKQSREIWEQGVKPFIRKIFSTPVNQEWPAPGSTPKGRLP